MRSTLRDVVAGAILVAFVATYLAMEWAAREPDSIVLVATVAIVIGAGFHLWDSAMGQGVDAAQDFQGGAGGGEDADADSAEEGTA